MYPFFYFFFDQLLLGTRHNYVEPEIYLQEALTEPNTVRRAFVAGSFRYTVIPKPRPRIKVFALQQNARIGQETIVEREKYFQYNPQEAGSIAAIVTIKYALLHYIILFSNLQPIARIQLNPRFLLSCKLPWNSFIFVIKMNVMRLTLFWQRGGITSQLPPTPLLCDAVGICSAAPWRRFPCFIPHKGTFTKHDF